MKSQNASLFRLSGPSPEEIDSFHNDGYIAYPNVLTDEARDRLIEEITKSDAIREYIETLDNPTDEREQFAIRNWDDRGPVGHALIDAPFIITLLRGTIGDQFHYCHSALRIAPRGIEPVPFHQDHHHWKHHNPVNIAERGKYYVQVLYYPLGFAPGDRSLKVIPGSHRIAPTEEATPEKMLAGDFDADVGRKLEEKHLSLPPGSMVYINARIFHGVEPKPLDSPTPYRIFNIDVFKEIGPPHRYTQEIPAEWIERASPERRRLFIQRGLHRRLLGLIASAVYTKYQGVCNVLYRQDPRRLDPLRHPRSVFQRPVCWRRSTMRPRHRFPSCEHYLMRPVLPAVWTKSAK